MIRRGCLGGNKPVGSRGGVPIIRVNQLFQRRSVFRGKAVEPIFDEQSLETAMPLPILRRGLVRQHDQIRNDTQSALMVTCR